MIEKKISGINAKLFLEAFKEMNTIKLELNISEFTLIFHQIFLGFGKQDLRNMFAKNVLDEQELAILSERKKLFPELYEVIETMKTSRRVDDRDIRVLKEGADTTLLIINDIIPDA